MGFLLETFPEKGNTGWDLSRGAPLPPVSSRCTDDAATAASNRLERLLVESTWLKWWLSAAANAFLWLLVADSRLLLLPLLLLMVMTPFGVPLRGDFGEAC